MVANNLIELCDAFVELMDPLIEVVIHNLETNKIDYINGQLSKRQKGDDSLLDVVKLKTEAWQNQKYSKLNFDGRLVKSISIDAGDNKLVCINCDISLFESINHLTNALIHHANSTVKPKGLFQLDWQDQLHHVIHTFIQNNNLNFASLTTADKKSIVKYLYDNHAFEQKNAADYIAKVLTMGRATIFKYLKKWRSHENVQT